MNNYKKVSLVFLLEANMAERWAYRQMNILTNDPYVVIDLGYFIDEPTQSELQEAFEEDDPFAEDFEEE